MQTKQKSFFTWLIKTNFPSEGKQRNDFTACDKFEQNHSCQPLDCSTDRLKETMSFIKYLTIRPCFLACEKEKN